MSLIYLFPTVSNDFATLIKNLQVLDYEPLVDTINGRDENWLKQNSSKTLFLTNRAFVKFEDLQRFPDLMIVFENVPDEEEIVELNVFFDLIWDEEFNRIRWTRDFREIESIVEKFFIKPIRPPLLKAPDSYDDVMANDAYDIEMRLVNETMFYQVTKPFTDLPYTTLIRDFEKRGHLPFFYSLFICASWGCSGDIAFLKHVWKQLSMGGEFTEDVVKAGVESCYPQGEGIAGEPEPVVYRRTIDQVLENMDKRQGLY